MPAIILPVAETIMIPVLLGLALFAPLDVLAADGEAATPTSTNQAALREPLTEEEARHALEHLHIPVPGQGTWLYLESGDYITNVTYEWRPADGRLLRRREEIQSWPENPSGLRRTVVLENGQESWTLFNDVAMGPVRIAMTNHAVRPDRAASLLMEKALELDVSDSEMASFVAVTGYRIREDGPLRLLIVEAYGKRAHERLLELLDPAFRKIKKQIPLVLRPLVTTSVLKSAIGSTIPVRRETIIDEASGELLTRRLYASDGSLVSEQQAWQPCTNLTVENYAVPKGMRLSRPPVYVSGNFENKQKADFDPLIINTQFTVKKDDVVLIEAFDGSAAVIQFTNFVKQAAFYRWRSRPSPTNQVEHGSGFVRYAHTAVQRPNAAVHFVPKPGNDTTIRAGSIWIPWTYADSDRGQLWYLPERAKVKRLPKGAFEKALK